MPFCRTEDVAVLAYSPLMHGLLSGQYAAADEIPEGRARSRHFRGDRPLVRHGEAGCEAETFSALESLRTIVRDLGRSMADVALAWCFQQPGVECVIAGASSPLQLRQNVAGLEGPLTPDVLRRLNGATQALADALGPNPDMWEGTARSRFR
jgi:aryl-alcohol dehydrogenase-like predicted oxidoreductase